MTSTFQQLYFYFFTYIIVFYTLLNILGHVRLEVFTRRLYTTSKQTIKPIPQV
ncbi:hypothetical protein BJX66DRAFT_320942 [Aspergillus keveii]|uniref:Uncharacterized protein n=1 Tax=Aspergillus keveii TaxID=714993 RepID=A0ABR4FGJ2_9EURO